MHRTKLDSQQMDMLLEAFLSLTTKQEMSALLEDLCTIPEVLAMTQRLSVAVMLSQGMTYQDISKKTGASTATISRVNRCLSFGAGGYQAVLAKNNWTETENQ